MDTPDEVKEVILKSSEEWVLGWVLAGLNSGPPSDDNSSGIPYVTRILHILSIRPLAPSIDRSTTGHN